MQSLLSCQLMRVSHHRLNRQDKEQRRDGAALEDPDWTGKRAVCEPFLFVFHFRWRRLYMSIIVANRKGLSNPDRQMEQSTGDRRVNSTREAASPWHQWVQSNHLSWRSPSFGGRIPHRQEAPGVLAARLNGRDSDKPNA